MICSTRVYLHQTSSGIMKQHYEHSGFTVYGFSVPSIESLDTDKILENFVSREIYLLIDIWETKDRRRSLTVLTMMKIISVADNIQNNFYSRIHVDLKMKIFIRWHSSISMPSFMR